MQRRSGSLPALLILLLGAVGHVVDTGGLGSPPGSASADEPTRPSRREIGPRLPPPFGGQDPARLGLERVDDLLWLRTQDRGGWRPGGEGVIADPAAGPGAGLTLRTDHVLLSTDLAAPAAIPLARLAQQHVVALMAAQGEALDLRLPAEPLRVVVFARRADFEGALRARGVAGGWNAYYDVQDGSVRVSAEPAAAAPLPLAADVRHELTHAVLDLGAVRDVDHARIVNGLHFWLWEGIAVESEGLGETGAGAAYVVREARFRERLARGELPTLEVVLRLPQERFEGRHYDFVAVFLRFLRGEAGLSARTTSLLRRLMAGDLLRNDPAREWGVPLEEVERRWRRHLGLGG